MSCAASQSADAEINEFIVVYQRLRKGAEQRVLSRRNFKFKEVAAFADALTIVDISTPDFWRIRLSGTGSCERSGQDKTGRNAQSGFADDELVLRRCLANSLFENPCGIRAMTRESYANSKSALLDTISLPLLGPESERLVVHYARVVEDFEHEYRCRPQARETNLISYDFVDLGHGTPQAEPVSLSA